MAQGKAGYRKYPPSGGAAGEVLAKSTSEDWEMVWSSLAVGGLSALVLSAGLATEALSAATFSNSNGVSFGLTNGVITGTVATNYQSSGAYLTTAALSDHSHGNPTLNLTNLTGTTASNSAGFTLSLSGNAPGGGDAIRGIAAGGSTASTNTVNFSNSNGVSFGFGAAGNSTVITGSHNGLTSQSNQALSGSNGSFTFQTATFGALNGLTFYTSNGSVVGSYTVPVQSNQTAGVYAVGTTTGASSSSTYDARTLSVQFGGFISGGWSNGSLQISATQTNPVVSNAIQSVGTATGSGTNTSRFAADDHIHAGVPVAGISGGNTAGETGSRYGSVLFAGGNNITISGATAAGGQTITISAGAGGAGSNTLGMSNVGNTSGTSGVISGSALQMLVVGGSNVTVNQSINGSSATLSINAAAPGGGATATMWFPYNEAINVVGAQGQATLHIMPTPNAARREFDRIVFPVTFTNASNTTGSLTLSIWFGLFTKNASTLSMLHSTSGTYGLSYAGNNSSADQRGIRLLTLGWTTTITEGIYYAGIVSRSTTAGANASLSQVLISQINSNFSGLWNAATNRSNQWPLGLGIRSASTSGIPDSLAFSHIDGTGSLAARPPSWFAISGTA